MRSFVTALLLSVAIAGNMACPRLLLADAALIPSHSRLGINLSGPADWNTELPFVDVFRLSREWISQKKGEPWGKGPALSLDDHGWVRKLDPDCFAETPILTGGHAPAGDYLVLYEGDGRVDFNNDAKIISRAPGRLVVHIEPRRHGAFLAIRETNPQNPVRNIHVLMPGTDGTWKANPFDSRFLSRWQSFNTIRFMDWMKTNGSGQKDWKDRPTLNDATWTPNGIPVEVMVDLCNRLKINPWFCMPHAAGDDYIRQFATLVKRTLDPSLRIYIEYSNEVWNGIFAQHKYAAAQAQARGLDSNEHPWEAAPKFYAVRSMEIFRIWEEAFGNRDRLVRVVAWQAASDPNWTDKILHSYHDLAKNCDAYAIAPYISFMPGPNGKNLKSDEVADWSLPQLMEYVQQRALPEAVKWMTGQKKIADKYGLKLICYEAGQHLVGVGGGENNDKLTRLLESANHDPLMGEIYIRYLDAWRDAGGDLICIFSSVGTDSKWGSWGLLQGADESSSPKFDAVINWNQSNPR